MVAHMVTLGALAKTLQADGYFVHLQFTGTAWDCRLMNSVTPDFVPSGSGETPEAAVASAVAAITANRSRRQQKVAG